MCVYYSVLSDADTEVSELTGSNYDPEEMVAVSNESTIPGDQASSLPQETSNSVKAFMKQVNRIRFNSITATNGKALQREGVARHFRTSSCPSLDSCDSGDVSDITHVSETHNPPDVTQISTDVSVVQSAPVMSQVVPPNTAEHVMFHKDDSVTTTDSYTTASHPTVSEDFQVTFPYHLLLASLPCAPQLRCYNCLRRERCRSDSATNTRGLGYCEDSAHKLPGISNVLR